MFASLFVLILLLCLLSKIEAYKIKVTEDGKVVLTSEPGDDEVEYPDSYPLGSREERDSIANIMDIVKRTIGNQQLFKLTPKLDAAFLTRMIRCKKYHPKLTLQAIIDYYCSVSILAKDPKFVNMVPKTYEEAFREGLVQVLSNKFEGTSVILVQLSKLNSDKFSVDDFTMALLFLFQVIFEEPETQAHGVTAIIDMQGFTFTHGHLLSKLFNVVLKMFPMRLHQAHIINPPLLFKAVFVLIKPFLRGGTAKRTNPRSNQKLVSLLDAETKILPVSIPGGTIAVDKAFNTKLLDETFLENTPYSVNWVA